MEPSLLQTTNLNLAQKREVQLALKLLEAPLLELAPILTQELEDNPLLEWEERTLPQGLSPEKLEAKPTLAEHLLTQLGEDKPDHTELLLGYLDERGLICASLEEMAWHHEVAYTELQRALQTLQTLEPKGICQSCPKEALLCQLRKDTLAYQLIQNHYDDLLHKRFMRLSKALNLTTQEVQTLIEQEVAPLNPHPGANFSPVHNPPLTPDLWITEEGDALVVLVKHAPSLQISAEYQKMLRDKNLPTKTKRYLKQKRAGAEWIIKALAERKSTLIKIGKLLVATQESFLRDPQGVLAPLTLTEVAAELGLHESTISRAVAHKTLAAPRGLLPLRACFSQVAIGDASQQEMKVRLEQLIEQEDKRSPYPDKTLSEKLGCSRRVVTKWRNQLGIGNAKHRRR